MALPMCAEAFIRSFFVILKAAAVNWFWTIMIVMIAYFLKRSPWMMGGFAIFIDFIQDTTKGLGIFSGGLLGVLGNIISLKFLFATGLAVLLGIIWVMMLLISDANLVLKLFALPVVLVAGVIAGLVPFISLPFSALLAFLFNDRKMANFTCISFIALIALLNLLSSFVCEQFNWIMTLF